MFVLNRLSLLWHFLRLLENEGCHDHNYCPWLASKTGEIKNALFDRCCLYNGRCLPCRLKSRHFVRWQGQLYLVAMRDRHILRMASLILLTLIFRSKMTLLQVNNIASLNSSPFLLLLSLSHGHYSEILTESSINILQTPQEHFSIFQYSVL